MTKYHFLHWSVKTSTYLSKWPVVVAGLVVQIIAVSLIIYSHTHTRLTAFCPGLPRWASTRKVKPIWILLEQETVSGSGISWVVCKSAPHSRQITMPALHHSVFTGRMPFLPPNQQRQSTEGNTTIFTHHLTDQLTSQCHWIWKIGKLNMFEYI